MKKIKTPTIKASTLTRFLNKTSTQLVKSNPELHYSLEGFHVGPIFLDELKAHFKIGTFNKKFFDTLQRVMMVENDKCGKRYGYTPDAFTNEEVLMSHGVSQKEQLLLGLIDWLMGKVVQEVNPQLYERSLKQAKEIEICEMFGVKSLDDLPFPVFC